MDDRFRNEGAESSGNQHQDSYYPGKAQSLGDFSVNIESKSRTESFPVTASKPKKFEVHIPDIDEVPSEKKAEKTLAPPSYTGSASASPRRPAHLDSATQGRRPGTAHPPRRPNPNAVSSAQKKMSSGSSTKSASPKRTSGTKTVPQNKKTPAKKNVSSAVQKRRNTRKYNFIKGVLVTCVCLIFITILTASVSTVALSVINDILVIDADNQSSVFVEIPEGSDYDEVFDILTDKGLIKQPFVTDIFCKFRHYDEVDIYENGVYVETRRIEYQPGPYYLDADAGIENMLETIMVRSNVAKDTIRLTFPEGWSIAQVFEKIEKYEVCEAEKLYANLEFIGEQYDFISKIEKASGRYLKAEGYLFPDTYDFYIGENASSVLKKLFNNFDSRWTSEYTTRLKELDMTQDQIINIASIIQREAKDGTQMADISSVIHNRLKDSATYPNLEMNSTKDYITSLKEYDLFSDVYYSLYLDKYNTYSQTGLPPGPICNPGRAAIEAALYPADTNYYFFCHDTSTGEIYLAETAAEHHENTAKVLYGNIGG